MKKIIKTTTIVLCIIIIVFAIWLLIPVKRGNTVLPSDSVFLFSHKANVNRMPDNTLAAIEEARQYGFRGIEIDVSLTHDKKVILFHDEENEFQTTVDVDENISEMNLEEIKKQPLLKDGIPSNYFIPTLEEMYDVLGDSMIVYLDLKKADFTLVNKVVEIITEKKAENHTILADGNILLLSYAKLKNNKISTALEGCSFSKKWIHSLMFGRLKPDYFSGFTRSMNQTYAHWLENKNLIHYYILYEVNSSNFYSVKKWGFKNMIIDDITPKSQGL